MKKKEKYIKPAQFVEREIINAIVKKKWAAGENVPPERELAELLGITRPTLREVLQRLARDGWITIKHGKPTKVNDYQNTGGVGIIKSLIKFNELTPKSLVKDWLELRILILPETAHIAIRQNKNKIIEKLKNAPKETDNNNSFAIFDWELQMLLIKYSENTIIKMLYNDLTEIYHNESLLYFNNIQAKKISVIFYENLKRAILDKKDVKSIVKQTMLESKEIWEKQNIK